jgi:hypothetical protein
VVFVIMVKKLDGLKISDWQENHLFAAATVSPGRKTGAGLPGVRNSPLLPLESCTRR